MMNDVIILDKENWTIDEIIGIWKSESRIALSEPTLARVIHYRQKLESAISGGSNAVYGINTGFGALCNQVIGHEALGELQVNLVRSHACGTGPLVAEDICRLILLLKIISLSKGHSGIRPELLEFLVTLYNGRIYPEIPERGSLGASGDLAPLAHLSLLCIGEGRILNQSGDVKSYFEKCSVSLPMLTMKEGLALLNGTQYTLAVLLHAWIQSRQLYYISNFTGALSMDSFNCSMDFLHEEIHRIRNQAGQTECAASLRKWLEGSNIITRKKNSVQDPYSFRCMPQVHGSSLDALQYVGQILTREINAVTDNPLMLSDYSILSGGNFHAQPLALAADFLCIAVSELGSISERRIYQLINGSRDLPDFLTSEPGLNSGYMIVQYSAASLVSQNKQSCTPASVDSIVTSKGQEDHVSMGANAAIKASAVAERTGLVLAMEWMTACRAWEFRPKDWQTGNSLQKAFEDYRRLFPFRDKDHIPSEEFESTRSYLMKLHAVTD